MNNNAKVNIVNLLSCFITAFLVVKVFYMTANVAAFSIVANIPNECRDLVQYRIIRAFVNGINPYSLNALTFENVPLVYIYTFLQPLCVAIVCKLTGMSIIAGNITVNIFCVFGTALCIWLIVKDSFSEISLPSGINIFMSILVTTGTFFAMFHVPIFTFRPDCLGIFLSVLILFIVYKYPDKVILSALITIALLHTKQILVVIAFPVFIYYLLNDAKSALKYFIACTFITLAQFAIIYYIFPLYWGSSIYVLARTIYGFKLFTAVYNLLHFAFRYVAFLTVSFLGIVLVISREKGNIFLRIKNVLVKFRHEYIMLIILNILSSLFFLLMSFARNGGDGVKYCSDMLAPQVVIFAFLIWKYAVISPNKVKENLKVFMLVLAAFCCVMFADFQYLTFSLKDATNYAEVWETIKQYDDGSPIYLGMVVNNYLADEANAEKNYFYYDDGQVELHNKNVNDTWDRHGILNNDAFNEWAAEFLYVDKIYAASREYVKNTRQMAADKKFSLIVTSPLGSLIDSETLNKNYKIIKSIELLEATEYSRVHSFYVPR